MRPPQPLSNTRHRMKDRLDPRRPFPLAILQVVERGDRPFHTPSGAASLEHPFVHLRHTTAARRGQHEQSEKRPEREPEAEVNGAGGGAQPIVAHQAGRHRDAREREAQRQEPAPQPAARTDRHAPPPHGRGELVGLEHLPPFHGQQMEPGCKHADNAAGKPFVVALGDERGDGFIVCTR